jgi:hypothetical protein
MKNNYLKMTFKKYTVHSGFLTCTADVISGVGTASTFQSPV